MYRYSRCIGIAGVSVISLPTTLVLTSGKGAELFKPLNKAIDTAQTQATTSFSGFDQQLTSQYTKFGGEVAEKAIESPKAAAGKLQEISTTTAELSQKINEHAATGNYYAFKLGHLIKAVLKHTPNIIKESFIEAFLGSDELHLLSAQKIYNIASSEKFSDFLTAMTDLVTQHDKLMENLSGEDNSGIIQIFKEIKNDEESIKAFLEKVKKNSDGLKSSSETYNCATKLMMHVLIGKEEMDKMNDNITKLTAQLNTLKEKLKTILQEVKVDFDTLTQQLTQISTKAAAIKDPCPNAQK